MNKEGWNTEVNKNYVKLLNKLDLNEKQTYNAYDLLNTIYKKLVKTYSKIGYYSKKMLSNDTLPKDLTNINRMSWNHFFKILEKSFNTQMKQLLEIGRKKKTLTYKELEKIILTLFGNEFQEDVIDLLYYLNDENIVKLIVDDNENILQITF